MDIVLIEPEIPNNTGNIGRLSLATGCRLHLIKPYGFEINGSRVKRAGLDYWKYVNLKEYESFGSFLDQNNPSSFAFYSSRAKKNYLELKYQENTFLIFGKESVGLPPNLINDNPYDLYKIPLEGKHVRSLNLANAVSIVVYEGLRQLALK
ncbi:MAG: tRNA (cytidine(34)-2'-O)-methyltransferase [Saprospiraceae bacterium]